MALISPIRIAIAAAVATAAFAQPARAAAPVSPPCGVTGSATAATTIQYDPFAPSGLSQIDIPLTLTRATAGGGAKTQEAYFVLTQPAGGPNYTIQANIGGSTYTNILYYDNAVPANLPVISSNTSGQVAYQFGGASLPDTATIQLRVTVPANVNLAAGQPIQFDIRYVCKGTGGMADVLTPTNLSKAISINVNVLSALQAGFVGSALDFGEIGTVPAVIITPQRTPSTNYVRVQSSGPYLISLTSGNAYKMTPSGAAAATSLSEVKYRLKFLGLVRSNASAAAISMRCPFAGVGTAFEDKLYLQAQLDEGGIGKLPSPNYLDTLTVTIAPQAAGSPVTSPGGAECSTLSGSFP